MKIEGLSKLSLLNYPEKVSCVVFTGGCNLRCPFCHNASVVLGKYEPISESEVLEYINSRKKVLDGVVVSGGEPLMHADIVQFISKIKSFGLLVKLDTNGCYPEKLKELVEKKLVDYVAMDIKNSFEKYGETTGCAMLKIDKVKQSIDYLLENHVDYELRTTLVKEFHTEKDIEEITHYISKAKRYYIQNYEDSGDILGGQTLNGFSKLEMEGFQKLISANIAKTYIRGY